MKWDPDTAFDPDSADSGSVFRPRQSDWIWCVWAGGAEKWRGACIRIEGEQYDRTCNMSGMGGREYVKL